MNRAEVAEQNFRAGMNCAQAVGLAFADLTGADEHMLSSALLPLGGGLGRLRETCGAVSGGAVVLGLCFPEKSKGEVYALVQKLALAFKERNGSYRCGELLSGAGVVSDRSSDPEARTGQYYTKRPCALLVRDAAEILSEILLSEGKEGV